MQYQFLPFCEINLIVKHRNRCHCFMTEKPLRNRPFWFDCFPNGGGSKRWPYFSLCINTFVVYNTQLRSCENKGGGQVRTTRCTSSGNNAFSLDFSVPLPKKCRPHMGQPNFQHLFPGRAEKLPIFHQQWIWRASVARCFMYTARFSNSQARPNTQRILKAPVPRDHFCCSVRRVEPGGAVSPACAARGSGFRYYPEHWTAFCVRGNFLVACLGQTTAN